MNNPTVVPSNDLAGKRAHWRQRGYEDGRDGWRLPRSGALPDDVPEEFRSEWWTGYRRGKEAREK